MHISRNYSLLKQYVNIQSQSGVIGANGRRVLSHAGTKNRRGREDEPALSAIRPNAMERPRRARLAIYQRIVQVGTICKSGILSRLFLKKKLTAVGARGNYLRHAIGNAERIWRSSREIVPNPSRNSEVGAAKVQRRGQFAATRNRDAQLVGKTQKKNIISVKNVIARLRNEFSVKWELDHAGEDFGNQDVQGTRPRNRD